VFKEAAVLPFSCRAHVPFVTKVSGQSVEHVSCLHSAFTYLMLLSCWFVALCLVVCVCVCVSVFNVFVFIVAGARCSAVSAIAIIDGRCFCEAVCSAVWLTVLLLVFGGVPVFVLFIRRISCQNSHMWYSPSVFRCVAVFLVSGAECPVCLSYVSAGQSKHFI
jgi:hypothetical protein